MSSEVGCDGGDSVGLLHAEFLRVANYCSAFGKRAGDGEDGDFIDHVWYFVAFDDRSGQVFSLDVDRAARFSLFDGFDDLANVGAHANKHVENAGARRIQTHVPNQQAGARLAGGGHQPERGAGNVAGHGEIARLDLLLAKHRNPAFRWALMAIRRGFLPGGD